MLTDSGPLSRYRIFSVPKWQIFAFPKIVRYRNKSGLQYTLTQGGGRLARKSTTPWHACGALLTCISERMNVVRHNSIWVQGSLCQPQGRHHTPRQLQDDTANQARLSKQVHVWKLKREGKSYTIKWKILRRTHSYVSKRCSFANEKLCIGRQGVTVQQAIRNCLKM